MSCNDKNIRGETAQGVSFSFFHSLLLLPPILTSLHTEGASNVCEEFKHKHTLKEGQVGGGGQQEKGRPAASFLCPPLEGGLSRWSTTAVLSLSPTSHPWSVRHKPAIGEMSIVSQGPLPVPSHSLGAGPEAHAEEREPGLWGGQIAACVCLGGVQRRAPDPRGSQRKVEGRGRPPSTGGWEPQPEVG